MKRPSLLFLTAAVFFVASFLPTFTQAAPSYCSTETRSGNDGTYNLCIGSRFLHQTAGLGLTVASYGDQYVKLNLAGSDISVLRLYRQQPKTITTNNNTTITFHYLSKDPVYGVRIQIASERVETCSDSAAYADGIYSGCLGDTLKHVPTGITATIASFDSGYLKLSLLGATLKSVKIPLGQSKNIVSNTNKKLTFSFKKYSSDLAEIRITSVVPTPSPLTAISTTTQITPTYGTFSGRVGDAFTHIGDNTGIIATIRAFDRNSLRLSFVGPVNLSSTTIPVGTSRAIFSNDGQQITFTYQGVTVGSGLAAFIIQSSSATPTPPALITPQLLSPASGSAFTGAQTIYYHWKAVSGAAYYQLMERDANSNSYYFIQRSDTNSYTSYHNVNAGGPRSYYYWKVRAYDSQGNYRDSNEWSYNIGPDTTTSQPRCLSGEGNLSGTDGLYSVCAGYHVEHFPSRTTFTMTSYNASQAIMNLSGQVNLPRLVLDKNVPSMMITANGLRVTLNFQDTSTRGALIRIDSTPFVENTSSQPTCSSFGNSAGNDGLYSACVGYTITHYPTGAKIKVTNYNNLFADTTLTGTGGVTGARLTLNIPSTMVTDNGLRLSLTYTQNSQLGAFIQVSSTSSATTPCANTHDSAAYDALYTICAGYRITHYPTGITATLTRYDDNVAEVDLLGSTASHAFLYKNQPNRIYSSDGTKFADFKYTQSSDLGAAIQITSR